MHTHDRYKNVVALLTVGNEHVYLYSRILVSSQITEFWSVNWLVLKNIKLNG